MIWGFAFVSQSVGAEYVGPFTFLAVRNWIATAVLLPVSLVLVRKRSAGKTTLKKELTGRPKLYAAGGALCGLALFLASAVQQIGIEHTTTAKAGFITALYVVIVPILSMFLGKMPGKRIWLCVLLSVCGLYYLCISGKGISGLNRGDLLVLLCSLLFSIQIMSVDYFTDIIDGILLSLLQTVAVGILATVFMLLTEKPDPSMIRAAMPALLYAGIMSSGAGYTLQIVGQEGTDPTLASLIMSLESVFSAVGGWLFLAQRLTLREFAGCALMFTAIVISQLSPVNKSERGMENYGE